MPSRSLDMDHSPPSLTTSPTPPQQTFFTSLPSPPETCCPSEGSTANDSIGSLSSPNRLPGDPPYEIPSPYSCSCIEAFSVAPAISEPDAFLHPLGVMSQSNWIPPHELSSASSSSGPSTVMSAEYDSFATYDSVLSTSYSSHHEPYAPPPPPQHLPATHPPSVLARHSTQASGLPPRPYEPPGPRVKIETSTAYGQPFGGSQYSPPSAINAPFASSSSLFSPAGHSYYGGNAGPSWAKQEYDNSQLYASPQGQAADPNQERRPLKVSRTRRQPRKHTTKEEANFQCEVEGCGKFFSRSYNYKSHLETHDEKREYPFPCTFEACGKKFVRKTDLQRHHQSVHMKERNHKCDYCGRLFARKDTLRRHMDDGCSKRFDIRTLDLQGEAYSNLSPVRFGSSSFGPFGQESATLPPINMNPITSPMRSRDYDGGDNRPSSDRGWQR